MDIIKVPNVTPVLCDDSLGNTMFCTTHNANRIALSVEDREFIRIMNNVFLKEDSNSWVATLLLYAAKVTLECITYVKLSKSDTV